MADDSFELKVVDVVEETADAHSISFEVPAGAEEQFAYKPGQFLTLAVPSDQTGVAARQRFPYGTLRRRRCCGMTCAGCTLGGKPSIRGRTSRCRSGLLRVSCTDRVAGAAPASPPPNGSLQEPPNLRR